MKLFSIWNAEGYHISGEDSVDRRMWAAKGGGFKVERILGVKTLQKCVSFDPFPFCNLWMYGGKCQKTKNRCQITGNPMGIQEVREHSAGQGWNWNSSPAQVGDQEAETFSQNQG